MSLPRTPLAAPSPAEERFLHISSMGLVLDPPYAGPGKIR